MEVIIDKAVADGKTIDAILAENDSTALGVVGALTAKSYGFPPLSGQDGDPANLNNVALGKQYVDVWKNANELGKTAGAAALALCQGTALADVTLPDGLIDPTVATERRAGAVGRAAAGTRAVIGAVALLLWLVDDTVAAARRERLREGHAVADDAVGADHLQGERAAVDRHAREPERRLVVGREAALRLQRVEIVATAAARDVDRTLPGRDHLVAAQRERPLVVVLVPHEHHVDAAGV